MNKPAAITLFAIVVLGIGGYGYIQYDYRNAAADAGRYKAEQIIWCAKADDAGKWQKVNQNFCTIYEREAEKAYDVALDKAKAAGVSSDRMRAQIDVAFWTNLVADKCDSTSIVINGPMPCSFSRSQLDNAEAALKAQRS